MCVYWRTRPAAVAIEFELAVGRRDFESANSLFIVSDDAAQLHNLAHDAKTLDVKVEFYDAEVTDWLAGLQHGRYMAVATFDDYVITQTGWMIASATGVEIRAQQEARSDHPKLSDAVRNWLPGILK